jgi:hypothetical protein
MNKILISLLLSVSCYAAPCLSTHRAAGGETLADLADYYFGDREYASAILLATNSRVSEGFPFVSDPNDLKKGLVCIPEPSEARRAHARYATYLRATAAMTATEPWETVHKLVEFPSGAPLEAATWVRLDQVARYRDKAPQDIWVTIEPHLKEFCSAFAKQHDGNTDELTLRLEQRLGLPPGAGKTTFLRLRLARATEKTIFRPCADPATDVTRCEAAGPSEKANAAYAAWFYRQYYTAYGLPRPSPYPWTALGYTFDWSQGADGSFQRIGESEFVIPEGTPIEVLGSVSTAEYCR